MKKLLKRILFVFVLLSVCLAIALWWLTEDANKGIQFDAPSPALGSEALLLPQGWSKDIVDEFEHADFGSKLAPLAWLHTLKRADSDSLFFSSESLQRYGFIIQNKSPQNPHSLPVGFSTNTDKTPWMGLTCAACHTGQINFKEQKIRLTGGASHIDYAQFEKDYYLAIKSTLETPQKLSTFKQSLPENSKEQLQERLALLALKIKNYNGIEPYGHGRLDAYSLIFNRFGEQMLQIENNAPLANAPVSVPPLWDVSRYNIVNWNASTDNTSTSPFYQNVIIALTVYGEVNADLDRGVGGYSSSVNFKNVGKIQAWISQLNAPVWPENILGKIDPTLVSDGKHIYQTNCQSCHMIDPKDKGELRANFTPLAEIGTDPLMATNFANAQSMSGYLAGRKALLVSGEPLNNEINSIDLAVHVAVGAGLNQKISSILATHKSMHWTENPIMPTQPVYIARPLGGIWASAPYLHNGSVPSLAQLLTPSSQRVTTFSLMTDFDPKTVGLSDQEGEINFNSALLGNNNQGHDFGTELSESQKWALIEYLKTL
jgi:hypothetical protein